MKESLHFVYDDVSTRDMGLLHVNLDNGLFQESFVASKSIKEIKIRGRHKPYFVEVDKEPFEFDLEVAFEDGYDTQLISDVIRWLSQDYYKEFYMEDNPDRRFLCMSIGDSKLVHNGLNQGYITFRMRCDSPFSYSPQYTEVYHVQDRSIVELDYFGNINCKPELYIEMRNENISIKNMSYGGDEPLEFKGLEIGEIIYLDSENEHLESNLDVYRYDNFNGNLLELTYGKNYIEVDGDCILKIVFRHTMAEGH